MAEVIAIVASGISIAQVAGQVTSSIVKIKNFWDQVKAAPEDISHLFREVDSFSLILQHIQDDLTQNALPEILFDKECVRQSLELCKSGAAELESLANDLAGKLERSSSLKRKVGSMKIVLKQDEIKKLKRRLKNAIRLLSLAYQCHTSAMVRLQPDIIVARLSSTLALSPDQRISELDDANTHSSDEQVSRTSKSTPHDLVTQQYNFWTSSPSWIQLLIGSLDYQRQNRQRRGRNYTQDQARYRFPRLLSMKVWEFERSRSLSDWSLNIRTYRIIPDDASILRSIERGDFLLVQDLLASKAAFVTDRDQWGCSLLHIAARHWRVEICQALIFQGADVCLPDFANRTPLQHSSSFASPSTFEGNSTDMHQNTARLLVDAGAHRDLTPEINALGGFCGWIDVFQYLQQQTYPPYYEWPFKERFSVARSVQSYCPDGPRILVKALTRTEMNREMVTYVDEYGNTILHYLAWKLALAYCWALARKCEDTTDSTNSWHALIKDVITAGAFLNVLSDRNETALHILIETVSVKYYAESSKFMSAASEILQLWLTGLQELGIDLASYGAEEQRSWLMFKHGQWMDHFLVADITGFSYGVRPEDWHFWFLEPTDIFAGEFWEMMESVECHNEPEPQIPGSWIEGS